MRHYSIDKMRSLLEDKRYNLSHIARITGLSPSGIQKVKAGSVPTASTLVALADALGKELDYFFDANYQYIDLKNRQIAKEVS